MTHPNLSSPLCECCVDLCFLMIRRGFLVTPTFRISSNNPSLLSSVLDSMYTIHICLLQNGLDCCLEDLAFIFVRVDRVSNNEGYSIRVFPRLLRPFLRISFMNPPSFKHRPRYSARFYRPGRRFSTFRSLVYAPIAKYSAN